MLRVLHSKRLEVGPTEMKTKMERAFLARLTTPKEGMQMALGQKLKTTQPNTSSVTVLASGNTVHHKRQGVYVNENGEHFAVNGYGGASSDTDLNNPTQSDMAKSLPKVDVNAGNVQTRTVSDKPQTPTFGAKRQTADSFGSLPKTLGNSQAEPVRKPGA
jgi:hypothetical protein